MTAEEVARRYYSEQRRLTARALDASASLWGELPPADFDVWFADHEAELVGIITSAQGAVVDQSLDYVGGALTSSGGDVAPDFDVDASQLVGVAGDGRPLGSLLYGAVIHARSAIAAYPDEKDRRSPAVQRRAWAEQGIAALITRTQTAIADAGRVAAGLGIIARPGVGYVRMLAGSSCSRCAVLAGRVYHSSIAFDRHPGCDCRHVPRHAADESADLAALDVRAYFDSLSTSDQDKKFTKAGAQAIRDGADPAQVVNARRGAAGLQSASGRVTDAEKAAIRSGRLERTTVPGGRQLSTTSEGMTRRGIAYKVIADGDAKREAQIKAGSRKRLMPEAIYEVAADRAEALDLLRRNGYLGPASVPSAKGRGGSGPNNPNRAVPQPRSATPAWMAVSRNVPDADRRRITNAFGRVPANVTDRLAAEGLRFAVGRTLSDLPDAQLVSKWSGRKTGDGRSLETTSFFSSSDSAVIMSTDGLHGSVSVELHEYGHAVDAMMFRTNPIDVSIQDQGAANLLGPMQKIAQAEQTYTINTIVDDPYIQWGHDRVRATGALEYWRLGSLGTARSGREEWVAEGFAAATIGDREALLRISGGDEEAADMLVWSFRRLGVVP